MVKREIIEEIRNAFRKFIKENPEVEAILLFGSYAKGEETSRSDVDVCLVIPNVRGNVRKGFKIMRKIWREVHLDFKKYDVKILELLPLYIQISIINKHMVIYAKNILDLYEYFYFNYFKLWKDQEKRINILTYVDT